MPEGDLDLVVLVTRVLGSAPTAVGDSMWRPGGGAWQGTVGGGQLEWALHRIGADLARQAVQGRRHRIALGQASDQCCGGVVEAIAVALPPPLKALAAQTGIHIYGLDGPKGPEFLGGLDARGLWRGAAVPAALREAASRQGDSGLITLDGVTYFVHVPLVRPPLWLFGAGHVGAALAPLLSGLGFAVEAFDARCEWNTAERLGPAVTRRLQSEAPGDDPPVPPSVLIATHSHRLDFTLLCGLLNRPTRYLGVIGSRSKAEIFRHRLAALGFDDRALSRLRMPMGVPGLGKKPLEVAVSVAAELLARGLHKPCTR